MRSGPAPERGADAAAESTAACDAFPPSYERYWSLGLSARLWAAAALLLPRVSAGGHVLDLCCGTGVDASAGMLVHARHRAPGARFVAADLRDFVLPDDLACDGAVCLGEGLHHLLTPGDLTRALRQVDAALRRAGFAAEYREARRDLGLADDNGRAFVVAERVGGGA